MVKLRISQKEQAKLAKASRMAHVREQLEYRALLAGKWLVHRMPRPAQPRETELYEAWHRQRLSVPPGITGLWQVSGQSKRPIDDMARADLAYIATMSLWLDLRIMLRTPGILLRGRRRSV